MLLLTDQPQPALQADLAAWAEARGWAFTVAAYQDVDVSRLDGLQAAVVTAQGAPLELLPADVPLVVVDQHGLQAGGRLSTVGEPGARHDQVGFLAGVMAGLASRSGRVGVVSPTGGAEEAVYRMAFLHGLRYGCPVCLLTEVAATHEAGAELRRVGVDVAFVVPGPSGADLQAALVEAGLRLVWSGAAAPPVGEEQLAGGVRLAPEALVPAALEALLAGQPGESWPYEVTNGGLELVGMNSDLLTPGRARLVNEVFRALAAGELDTGVDPATGEARP